MNAERKKKLKAWKETQRDVARAALPLTDEQMQALFAAVDAALQESGCDHTHRLTREYLRSAGISPEPVVSWLCDNGGCCDCEVLWNAEPAWRETLR